MSSILYVRLALFGLALGACAAAQASVDTSPGPGGVYRLKPGIYVARDVPCDAPPNAAIRRYDARGIATAHSHACRVTIRTRIRTSKGWRYTVDQSCIGTGAGPGKRWVQRQRVAVRDALTFVQTIGDQTVAYRYCPAYQLPPGLREAAR